MFMLYKIRQEHPISRRAIVVFVVRLACIGIILLCSGLLLNNWFFGLPYFAGPATVATNGSNQLDAANTVTVPVTKLILPDKNTIGISSFFDKYYQEHAGTSSLGAPITMTFPTDQGWLQFFEMGALLLPAHQYVHSESRAAVLATVVKNGVVDKVSGVVRLPLLEGLLAVGSQLPLGGAGSSLTYVDLRKAALPTLMQPLAIPQQQGNALETAPQGVFIKGGMRDGKDVGHLIPQTFWSYLQRPEISPDGWKIDFGAPLTEALSFTLTKDGAEHHMLVQAFEHDGVLLDQDARDASGQLVIQRLTSGLDYLHTVGLPTIEMRSPQNVWSQADTIVFKTPNTGYEMTRVGGKFAFKLLKDTTWTNGLLWYHVQWSLAKGTSKGWVPATALTFLSPGNVVADISFNALSPDLANYLASNGDNVSAVVYDLTRRHSYTYNSKNQFIVASSIKVPIMLAFLDKLEQQNLEPDDQQMELLTTMIENSDNDSASELYYNQIDGAAGLSNFLDKIGVTGLTPNADAWGYSQITAQTMVDLLTALQQGKILTAHHRALALDLMEHVESDQRVGVGDTASSAATISMKDGWVQGPDDLWAMNTSGIVTIGKETYIISIYTQEQPTLEDGQALTQKVCRSVAALLT